MSIIKSFSFPDRSTDIRGDMFYIEHNNGTFTVIDCFLKAEGAPNGRRGEIIREIKERSAGKLCRFISTHPDQDHIEGLDKLDDQWPINNFYSVPNECPGEEGNLSLSKYIELRDSAKVNYNIERNITRAWLNTSQDGRDGAGINFYWPYLENDKFKEAQLAAKNGQKINNICPIFTYSLRNGAKVIWMGDLETEMQEEFYAQFRDNIPHVDILFQPHHGRKSGAVPAELLEVLNPSLIVIGNAPSEYIDYGNARQTITQNTSGDLVFSLERNRIHVYSQHMIPNKPAIIQTDWNYAFANNFRNMTINGCNYRGSITINR